MRLGRRTAAIFAATASLALVAAAAPGATAPTGTASTTMSAVDLDVTTPAGAANVGVLDAETFASNAIDEAINPKGGPWARSLITPLTGPGGPLGQAEARSDGDNTATASEEVLENLGVPAAGLSASVSPVVLKALASAESATASIDTVTAEVAALAGALGLDVNATGIASKVDGSGASATQGLSVAGVEVVLGDLLPADVLAQLPLGDLLDLLEALPVGLPVDVQSTIDDLRAAIDGVVAQLVDVQGAADALDVPLSQIADIDAQRATVVELQRLLDASKAIDATAPTAGDELQVVVDGVTAVAPAVDGILSGVTDAVPSVPGVLTAQSTAAEDCLPEVGGDLNLAGAATQACIAGLLSDTVSALTGIAAGDVDLDDAVAQLDAVVTDLVSTVDGLVDDLLSQIDGLVPLLGAVDTAALDLGDLLAQLTGLIDGAAGTPLVSVGTLDIGVNASSNGTTDGATATVLCEPVNVTVLAQTFSSPSCDEGLEAVAGVSDLVGGAVTSVADVLNTLPLQDVVTADELEVALFTDLQESVTQDGEIVTATAGVTALDLKLPSITVDPAPVTDLLTELGLPDVLGTVQAVLDDAIAAVDPVADLGLTTVRDTLAAAEAGLGGTGGIGQLTSQLDALIAGLDLGELGTLDSITTPSLALRIDPVSTAAFAPGTKAPVGAPTPEQPSLPATGGGAVLLGLLAMGGAAGLMRRR